MSPNTKIQPLCILLLFLLFLANKAVANINPSHRLKCVERHFVGVTTVSVSYSYNYIVDQNKNRRDSLNFDPCGNRRDYTSPFLPDETTHLFERGYCGHEHLDRFKIINMNARLYDPVIGRFFSPDPYVQMPDNTQSYNRYSYCLNNQMMYQSGWKIAVCRSKSED